MSENIPLPTPDPISPVGAGVIPTEPVLSKVEGVEGSHHKKFPLLTLILLILLSLAAAFSIYLFLQVRTLTLEQTTPSPSPTPLASIDPTATWQTFKNPQAIFTFKYPNEIKIIRNCFDGVKCYGKKFLELGTGDIIIEQFDHSPNCQNLGKNSWAFPVIQSHITIGGLDSLLIESDNPHFTKIMAPYSILYTTCTAIGDTSVKTRYNADEKIANISQFKQILSTFKFTD